MNQATFNQVVNQFKNKKDKYDQSLNMHSLLIKKNEQCYLHDFNDEKRLSDIRSISKTVLTLVLGVVIRLSQEGKYPKINDQTYIYPIIQEKINLANKENLGKLKQVKIKHLLTHTVGYEDVLLMRGDIRHLDPFEYLDYVINAPIKHAPGDYFLYSNAGFYLLGVVLQEFLQENLLIFIQRELFDPLGVTYFKWETYGDYIAGATRLYLYPEDLLKLGELLLENGQVNGKQLIQANWIQKMLTPIHYTQSVDTPHRTFRRYAYGYGIWLAKAPFYFGHGTDGQTLTIIPHEKTIIITLAKQPDIKPIEQILNDLVST